MDDNKLRSLPDEVFSILKSLDYFNKTGVMPPRVDRSDCEGDVITADNSMHRGGPEDTQSPSSRQEPQPSVQQPEEHKQVKTSDERAAATPKSSTLDTQRPSNAEIPSSSDQRVANRANRPPSEYSPTEQTPKQTDRAGRNTDREGRNFVLAAADQQKDPAIRKSLENYPNDYQKIIESTLNEATKKLVDDLGESEKIGQLSIEGHGGPEGRQRWGGSEMVQASEFEKLRDRWGVDSVLTANGCRVAIGPGGDKLLKKIRSALGSKGKVKAGIYFQRSPLGLEGTYKEIDETGVHVRPVLKDEKEKSLRQKRVNLLSVEFWRVMLALYNAQEGAIANPEIRQGFLNMTDDDLRALNTEVGEFSSEDNVTDSLEHLILGTPLNETLAGSEDKVGNFVYDQIVELDKEFRYQFRGLIPLLEKVFALRGAFVASSEWRALRVLGVL